MHYSESDAKEVYTDQQGICVTPGYTSYILEGLPVKPDKNGSYPVADGQSKNISQSGTVFLPAE